MTAAVPAWATKPILQGYREQLARTPAPRPTPTPKPKEKTHA